MENQEKALMRQDATVGARGIQLRTFQDYMDLAHVISEVQGFCPRDYYKKPMNVLLALQYGAEIGLTPMQSVQTVAVINGKPSVYGDGMPGLALASGLLEDMEEGICKEGDDIVATCKVKRKGIPTPIERRFSRSMAMKAKLWNKEGPWTNYPARMLQMRARGFALRDAFADVFKGLISAEEAQDYPAQPPPEVQILKTPGEVEAELKRRGTPPAPGLIGSRHAREVERYPDRSDVFGSLAEQSAHEPSPTEDLEEAYRAFEAPTGPPDHDDSIREPGEEG